jgi:hypothetical protein
MWGLADYYKLDQKRIGKHYGANKPVKGAGTIWRSLQLAPIILKEEPDVWLPLATFPEADSSGPLDIEEAILKVKGSSFEGYERSG